MHACSALMWRDLHRTRGMCMSRIEVIPCLKVIKAGELDREIIHQLSSKKKFLTRRSLSLKSKEDASLNWSVLPICKFYCADLSSSRCWPICTRKQDSDQVL